MKLRAHFPGLGVSKYELVNGCVLTKKGPPYFGPLYAINFSRAWVKFHDWAHQYGPIYQVTIFGTPWVWISDTRIAQELLSQRAYKYSDRIALHNVKNTKDNGEFLPLLRHGGELILGYLKWN